MGKINHVDVNVIKASPETLFLFSDFNRAELIVPLIATFIYLFILGNIYLFYETMDLIK